jgi:dihydroflavonol-4-reductase
VAGGGDLTLVTGASGFVGSAVARALKARGARLRLLVRAKSPRTNLDGLDAEVVVGDMGDPASMAAAMQGVRHLFHVAADYRLWARGPEEIVRNNLKGTQAVLGAARDAGVERVVYTSSVATLGFRDDGTPSDETLPLKPGEAMVSPSTPIGPRDVKPTPTGRIIVEAAEGRMPAFLDTGLNLVHVDDVAAGHLAALDKGRQGENYILGGQDVSLGTMLADIAGLVGRKPPTVSLPRAPLYPLAVATEAVAYLTGKEPFLTRDALKMSRHHMFFSSAKAERELGYHARPYADGLSDALEWFRQAGYVH